MTEEIVSGAEIARRLGVSRERVRQWASDPRYHFPAARGRIGPAKAWVWDEVRRWATEHGYPKPRELAET